MNHKGTIAILGSGMVGITLANGLDQAGYSVLLSNRKASSVDGWSGKVEKYADAVNKSDIVILSVKGTAAEEVVSSLSNKLEGKTVIDTTNPITDSPPDEGVLSYFTSLDESLMERLQKLAPKANFVKAFNSVGNSYMVNPTFKDGAPSMFICGNSDSAKADTIQILNDLGWGDVQDFGGVKSARAIEPLCMLWCIPGFVSNEWSHAFKYLKS